jgi:hypothetical protein
MIDLDALVIGPTIAIFGEPVTYADEQGVIQTVSGVFDSAYRALPALGGEYVMDIHSTVLVPVLGVRMSDFPVSPYQGMELTIRSNVYAIKEVQTDGHGHAKLLLNLGSYEP